MKPTELILYKDHLSYWLRQLRKERELIGPLRGEETDIVFKSVENIHDIVLDLPAILPTVKEFLFPQYEPMFKYLMTDEVVDLRDNTKRVIFGVRSCDVTALTLLDKFFLDGYKDPFYEERRNETVLISIVCGRPEPECFCAGLNTGPYLEKGFDVQLTDLGDRFFVQVGSPKGHSAVMRFSFLFRKPYKADYEDQYEVFLSSKATSQKRISLEGARQLILSGKVKDDFWRMISDKCFECGGCVYQCPLCTCFTVTDRVFGDIIERVRLWDACLFKGFTRLAGGILPNEERYLRTKRWFYHKLIYYPDALNGFGCVGCGRCTIACPTKIDMASVITRLKVTAGSEG
ncbi:MAG: 4Fe-4S dicluster domain-containing protein [Nitrospirae bacterium]|nr:4Fe-4S dicluster domain-containing protein [Nitrospirota bacterium]